MKILDRSMLVEQALLDQKNNKELAKYFNTTKEVVRENLKLAGIPHKNRCGLKSNLELGVLSSFKESVLVGTLLGDGCLGRTRGRGNARYRIVQGISQKLYADHKFETFLPFSKWLHVTTAKAGNGKIYGRVESETSTHPIFTWWYFQFYRDGVKIVPSNIEELLDPVALAYWFMDDGGTMNFGSSLRLSTNSFEESEVVLLRDALNQKFGFNFDIKENNGPILRYYKPQPFLEVVRPYVIESMRYKMSSLGYVKMSAPEITKGNPTE